MQKKWLASIALVSVLAVPTLTRAHEGHAHKVMGTVSSIEGTHLMVKTTDGKTVMVMLDDKTKITQGKNKVELSVLKVGDRVVAEGRQEKDMLTAASLKVGEAAAAPAKK
jgi:hypothetical protein